MKYLSSNDIFFMNSNLIGIEYPDNLLQEDRIESAVAQIKQNIFGKELYEGLFLKAATLCFLISKGHGFVDGNKRTASVATIVFLKINGYFLLKKHDRTFEKNILKLTTSKINTEDFSKYLQSVVTKI